MARKLNCWEFHNCGREKGGLMAESLGECPISTAMSFDGTNHGLAGGRACWMIRNSGNRLAGAGLCVGISCQSCEFYRRVQYEESGATKHRISLPAAN